MTTFDSVLEALSEADNSVEFLCSIIDHVGHPIFVKDRSFRFVLLNRALCEMVGYTRKELLLKNDYDFFPKAEADFFRQKDSELFASGVEVTIDEERITDKQGRTHVLATTKVPLRNARGEVTHLVGIIHDITRIKRAEDDLRVMNAELERRVSDRTERLELAQNELVRKERLAVLGQLAGGLAHQIRNPLGAITNAAYVLQRGLARNEDPEVKKALSIIFEEVWQANRIITDLLDYARVKPPDRHPVDIRTVVEQALASQAAPPSVTIEREMPALPPVAVDQDQVRDALENLIRNALEAMPFGGTLTLRTERAGAELVVSVRDTGAGIPPELRGRLFEPLVTSKPLGLGLGLTTTRALIENQGGSISCSSGAAGGTCFEIRLPLG
jgi:PAS domain S-box-containing protein